MLRRSVRLIVVALGVVAGLCWAAAEAQAAGSTPPTFTKDVAPILFKNCVICHKPGDVAPMSLLTYDNARPWAKAIKAKVVSREMPPWHADPAYGRFRNDRRLTQQDIDTIVAWANAGAPKGNDADLPPTPQFATGWLHPSGATPDYVIEMPVEVEIPAEGEIPTSGDLYAPFTFTEEKFIEAIQVRPGNRAAVHHMTAEARKLPEGTRVEKGRLVDSTTGKWIEGDGGEREDAEAVARRARGRDVFKAEDDIIGLGVYTPGWFIEQYRPGAGMRLPVGWYAKFGVHYQATGKPETDRSNFGVWFQKVPMTEELLRRRIGETHVIEGKELLDGEKLTTRGRQVIPNIPPYAENWAITGITPVYETITVYNFIPHMHLRGKDIRYVVVYPDGREETVLNVPKYDFNWQIPYELTEPLHVPAGSKILTVGHYDNSPKNRNNPTPEKEVFWSEQSWDEMYNGFIRYSIDSKRLSASSKTQQQ